MHGCISTDLVKKSQAYEEDAHLGLRMEEKNLKLENENWKFCTWKKEFG
jgi:hypothetical protein